MKTTAMTLKEQNPMNMPKLRGASLLLGVAALLSACGGGGGDAAPTPPPANGAAVSKTRVLPAFDVTVTPTRVAGALATSFEVKVSDPANVTALKAAIGADVDSGVLATATAGAAGTWTVAVPAGSAPEAGLQLLLTMKDGDSVETGTADFPLK
ncbi:MAG: hypothetical protein V4857_07940 [Pseudomonadota bacterium]